MTRAAEPTTSHCLAGTARRRAGSWPRRTTLLAAVLAAGLALPAGALEIEGVKLPDTLTVGGKELRLNGAGLRKKWIVKVYVGGLYLEAPSHDAEAIATSDAPKAVRMVFLREVTVYQMMNAFRDGFNENYSEEEAKALKAKLRPAEKALVELQKGSVLLVSYVPGQGSTVQVEGHEPVTIPGREFGEAIFRNWIGKKPADGDLKKGMLGG